MPATDQTADRTAEHGARPAVLSEALGHAISDKRLEVLRRVGETGSISQAARDAGISYKAAWQAIDTLTSLCGVALVECTVGGAGGGGARITPQGTQLLALAQELAVAREQVLARLGGAARLVGGLGLRTSMRNQLPCCVLGCGPLALGDPITRVHLRTPGGAELWASLTRESADLLGLAPGLEVLALCKATAVAVVTVPRGRRSTSPPTAQPGPGAVQGDGEGGSLCVLPGTVQRVSAGQVRDEVVLALGGGGHWVGFAAHPFKGRAGDAALASMPSSALVVGLAA